MYANIEIFEHPSIVNEGKNKIKQSKGIVTYEYKMRPLSGPLDAWEALL